VQAFSHPLWFATVAATRVVVGDPVLAATILSWVLALATFWLLARGVGSSWDRVLVLLALTVASRAFIDFSSSGLEDPLSHLLLVLLALPLVGDRDRPAIDQLRRVAWPAGLLLLCRHDNLWLAAPPMLWLGWRAWRTDGQRLRDTLRAASPSLLPFLAWTVFSVGYYGFPFPNTAYAKLNTGIAGHELWARGVDYLTHTAAWDPVSVMVIAVGMLLWKRRGGVGVAMVFGMVLHLLYVVRIGGDFMAGRFLSEPFVVGLVAISGMAPSSSRRPALVVVVAFLVLWPLSPFRIDDAYSSYHFDDHQGIADERAFYSGRNSWSGFDRRWPIPLWRSQSGPQEHFEVGFSAYSSGTDRIVIDRFALADPLLARLPAVDGWKRVGHFKRAVPAGYVESLRSGKNEIENPFVHRLYDDLRLVTQGPLLAAERWAAIWRLNLTYRRPGCSDPPCRRLVTHLLPPDWYSPLLPLVSPALGGVDAVYAQTPEPPPNLVEEPEPPRSWVVEGRVPFSLLAEDQLVRVFLPAHPSRDSLELAPAQDPGGDLAGFRIVLTFDDPAMAQQAAASLCVAVAADGGEWRLLPRLDSAGAVCSRLALAE
jgi:arabinofuranosyltransferase